VPPKSISGTRKYSSALRQQQAEATRSRILAASVRLFSTQGYARTTLAKIAAAAGVSAETVQGQGPKAALLIAAVEYAAFGVAGEENLFNLDVGRQLLAIDDREEAGAFIVDAVTDVHRRTAPLAPALFGGASMDPEVDRYLGELIASINKQIRRVLDSLRNRGWLREDVSFDELVETVAVFASVETYLRMTARDGWSVDAYRAWCARMLTETVFVSPQPTTIRPVK